MTDLGPLLAAVRDEWERGKTIAERAGIDSRTAGMRLGALERDGFVQSKATRWDGPERGVKLYRRGPNAPPVEASPDLHAAAAAIYARHANHCPPGSWKTPGHDVIRAEWDALAAALGAEARP